MQTPFKVFMLFCVLNLAPSLFADDGRLSIGGFGGVNVGRLSPGADLTDANSRRAGVTLGMNMEFNLGSGFFVQPEAAYIQKGDSVTLGGVTSTEHLDYFEHALLIKVKIGPPEFRLHLEIGPSFGFAVARYADTSDGSGTKTDLSSQVASTDLSMLFGFGADFKMEDDFHFIISGRYLYGATDLRAQPPATAAGSTPSPALTNRGIQIIVGTSLYL